VSDRLGIIGLGVMGSAMARHLIATGFEVNGYDIEAEKVVEFTREGGRPTGSAAEVAENSDITLFSLPSVASLEQATEDFASNGRPGLVVVETGTLPLIAKQEARTRLAAAGVDMMDVPLSGTGLQAADATLVVLASGSEKAYERCIHVFDVIGRSQYYLGQFGNGSVMKYIANLLVTVHTLSAAEAHALGIAAGLDSHLVQQVISDGTGSSDIFEIRGPMMAEDRYEPPSGRLSIILKDATIIRDFARSVGSPTPLLDASVPLYLASIEAGLGELDAAALCRYLEQTAGLARRS
jgi:putative dehydrogenase